MVLISLTMERWQRIRFQTNSLLFLVSFIVDYLKLLDLLCTGKFRFSTKNPTDYGTDYEAELDKFFCTKPLPLKEQFIGFVFKDSGYRTARLFDDTTIYAYECAGFKKKIFDHNSCQFMNFWNSEYLRKEMHIRSCREPCHDYFDHFMEYVKVDSKKPKFMFQMLVGISHDNPVHAGAFDSYYYRGFKENMKKVR